MGRGGTGAEWVSSEGRKVPWVELRAGAGSVSEVCQREREEEERGREEARFVRLEEGLCERGGGMGECAKRDREGEKVGAN